MIFLNFHTYAIDIKFLLPVKTNEIRKRKSREFQQNFHDMSHL